MKRNAFVYTTTRKMAQWVFSILYRIETEKRTALPSHGPMIILPKHQYWTDIPIISLAFKPLLYFVAKKELFRYPLVREYLSLLGGLPVDRKQSIRTLDSFKVLVSLLRAGEQIVIFPEGKYVRNGVGSGKSRLLQMILKLQPELGYSIPFVRSASGMERGRVGGGESKYALVPAVCRKRIRCHFPDHRAIEAISHLCRLPLSQSSEF